MESDPETESFLYKLEAKCANLSKIVAANNGLIGDLHNKIGNEISINVLAAVGRHNEMMSLFLKQDCFHSASIEKAVEIVTKDNILVYIKKLHLYGVFTVEEYVKFSNQLYSQKLSKYKLLQIFSCDIPQDVVVSCSNNKTVDIISKYADEHFGVKISAFQINNRHDVIIHKRVENYDAAMKFADKLIDKISEHYDNISESVFRKFTMTINRKKYVKCVIDYYQEIISACLPTQIHIPAVQPIFIDLTKDEAVDAPLHDRPYFDVTPYIGNYCIYSLQLPAPHSDHFKYGLTTNIQSRLQKHWRTFRYVRIIKVFVCASRQSMVEAEKMFKRYAVEKGINARVHGQIELVKTDDIPAEINILEKFVEVCNNLYAGDSEDEVEVGVEIDVDADEDEGSTEDADADAVADGIIRDDKKLDPDYVEILNPTTIAKNWINANPPKNPESKTDYYQRYKDGRDKFIVDTQFAKIIRQDIRYKSIAIHGKHHWSKK